MAESQKPLKLHLLHFGCAKNLVDSERILGLLNSAFGSLFVSTPDPKEADLALVNTCAFLKDAVNEALEGVFQTRKALKPGARLVVLGCLPSRYKELTDLPEADAILPRERYGELPSLVSALFPRSVRKREGGFQDIGPGKTRKGGAPANARERAPEGTLRGPSPPPFRKTKTLIPGDPGWDFEETPRVLSTPPFRAYLKISEGCSRRCSFCVIPKIRGKLVSRPLDALVREAEDLSARGVLELTLVAQDLLSWRDGDQALLSLLKRLNDLPGLIWLRLLYLRPEAVTKKLLRGLKGLEKVVPYLDVPLQHASKKILQAMGRRSLDPLSASRLIRDAWPEAALRSSFITGFPGETEKDFLELYEFLAAEKLQHAGFFIFSPEEGAPAAGLPGRVSPRVAQRRLQMLRELQTRVSEELNLKRLGTRPLILTDGASPENPLLRVGRTAFQAPETDGLVYFQGRQPPDGKMVRGRIIEARGFDLLASLEDPPEKP
ncbi:MAG: 30S ribosomal protein S12 methylthiotransferase RimO [Deltaproteobacteria bacterium]|nr:30S ribosomal protein S12 methylthiotransferase RimO [Deltaproteobacteria bacterium]